VTLQRLMKGPPNCAVEIIALRRWQFILRRVEKRTRIEWQAAPGGNDRVSNVVFPKGVTVLEKMDSGRVAEFRSHETVDDKLHLTQRDGHQTDTCAGHLRVAVPSVGNCRAGAICA